MVKDSEIYFMEVKRMFCSKCGTEIPDNAVFCPECGNRLGNTGTGLNYQTKPTYQTAVVPKRKKFYIIIAAIVGLAVIALVSFFLIRGAGRSRKTESWENAVDSYLESYIAGSPEECMEDIPEQVLTNLLGYESKEDAIDSIYEQGKTNALFASGVDYTYTTDVDYYTKEELDHQNQILLNGGYYYIFEDAVTVSVEITAMPKNAEDFIIYATFTVPKIEGCWYPLWCEWN